MPLDPTKLSFYIGSTRVHYDPENDEWISDTTSKVAFENLQDAVNDALDEYTWQLRHD